MAKHRLNGIESTKGQGFDNNPQNINRKGRPKKSYGKLNDWLKSKGYDPVSGGEYRETLSRLIGISVEDLVELKKDKSMPAMTIAICNDLVDAEAASKVIKDNRDWLFGKAIQTTEISVESKSIEYIDIGLGNKQKEAE